MLVHDDPRVPLSLVTASKEAAVRSVETVQKALADVSQNSLVSAAAVAEVPLLSAKTPALQLFMQLGSDPSWTSLPALYSMFYTGGYANNPIVTAMPQKIKQQYIAVGTVPKYNYPSYPVTAADLATTDENTFLHSTDPALLTIWKSPANASMLSWRADQRPDAISAYRVYKASLPKGFTPGMLWSEWWKTQSFVKIADIPYSSASTFSFEDKPSSSEITNDAYVCYMIKNVIATGERMFSYPVCATVSKRVAAPPVYLTGIKASKGIEVVDATNPLYANVSYTFDAVLSGLSEKQGTYSAQLVIYNQDNGLGVMHSPNQQIGPLVEQTPRISFVKKPLGGGMTLQTTLRRPYMTFVQDVLKITETPVFRIAVTEGGKTTLYPLDGGYYTFGINNRVQDRLWYGSLVNPGSAGWFKILQKIATQMQSRGFTGVFFDTWAPDFPEQFSSETPSIELNPKGVMTNQYTQTLHALGPKLTAAFPTMTFFANTIEQIGDTVKEVDSIRTIHGGMSESCIIRDGERLTGASLMKQIEGIEMIFNLDKTVLCWPKYQQNRWGRTIAISPFDPTSRIYALATALSITPGVGERGKLLFGPEELYSLYTVTMGGTIGQSINYYPEYRVPIGAPTGKRQIVTKYQWQRSFEKGIVVVNADQSAAYEYMVPHDRMFRVRIVNEALEINQMLKKVVRATPGEVVFEAIAKGTKVSLAPGTALILVSSAPLPKALPLITITSPDAASVIAPGSPMTVLWSAELVTDSQLTINLYRNNTYLTTLGAYIPVSKGSFNWTMPATMAAGTGYMIAIGTLGAQQLFSVSPLFSVGEPMKAASIAVTHPTQSTSLTLGSSLGVTWSATAVTDSQLIVNLYKNNVYISTLAANLAVSQGAYSWKIPENLLPGADYQIALGTTGAQKLFAISPKFALTTPVVPPPIPITPTITPTITVKTPVSGVQVTAGTALAISWGASAVTDANLTINLNRNGTYVTTLGTNIPVAQGAFSWTVPTTILAGSGYSLSMGTLGTQQVYAVSPVFSIASGVTTQPTLTFGSPNSSTVATRGTPLSVVWTSAHVTDTQLTVNLYKDGLYVTTLGAYIPVTQGSLSWTIPTSTAVGTGYAVAIGTLGTQKLFAISPKFSIQ